MLLHRDRKTITYNEVVSALLTDDLQQKLVLSSQPTTSSGTALNVNRGRSQTRMEEGDKRSKHRSKSKGKSFDKKTMVCWKCGKAGHMKQDCRSKAKEPSSANVANEVTDEEADLLEDDYAL